MRIQGPIPCGTRGHAASETFIPVAEWIVAHPAAGGKSVLDGDSDDDGNSNDYDLNDSFIDDEEEEEEYDHSDEDSDWQPDSEEREDIDTLMKEAKRFSKNQK
nr:PREDICTED: aprataxin and PNK-like factor [Latimeria chalumnae]|eukprot:XP_014344385.1 PREDICTED: aprataxin and PNK-like factor [Latimeria chalumnae]